VFDQLSERKSIVKKLLSVLVVAGFLAGLGCGGDSGPAKKDEKKGGATTGGAGAGAPKEKAGGKKEKEN
jgi:hypothetical protein